MCSHHDLCSQTAVSTPCLSQPFQDPSSKPARLKGPASLLRVKIYRKKLAEKAESQDGVSQVRMWASFHLVSQLDACPRVGWRLI